MCNNDNDEYNDFMQKCTRFAFRTGVDKIENKISSRLDLKCISALKIQGGIA